MGIAVTLAVKLKKCTLIEKGIRIFSEWTHLKLFGNNPSCWSLAVTRNRCCDSVCTIVCDGFVQVVVGGTEGGGGGITIARTAAFQIRSCPEQCWWRSFHVNHCSAYVKCFDMPSPKRIRSLQEPERSKAWKIFKIHPVWWGEYVRRLCLSMSVDMWQ